jgi:hypothetical protein
MFLERTKIQTHNCWFKNYYTTKFSLTYKTNITPTNTKKKHTSENPKEIRRYDDKLLLNCSHTYEHIYISTSAKHHHGHPPLPATTYFLIYFTSFCKNSLPVFVQDSSASNYELLRSLTLSTYPGLTV